jgi:putative hemolysin
MKNLLLGALCIGLLVALPLVDVLSAAHAQPAAEPGVTAVDPGNVSEPLPANDKAPVDLGVAPAVETTGAAVEEAHERHLQPSRPQPEPPSRSVQGIEGVVTIMTQNFEGAFPTTGWTVFDDNGSDYGELYWDDDDYKPYTGYWSAWAADDGANGLDPTYDNYADNMDSWMVYGPFNLSDATDADLMFYYWNESELNYDYFGWYASINDYNYYGYRTSGNTGGWVYQNFDLASVPTLGNLAGQPSVYIAFIFQSDGSYTYKGPFVDDVTLQKSTVSAQPNLVPYAPSGWDYPIVPSSVAGTHIVNDLYAAQTTYVDWAAANTGSADITTTFHSCLYFDAMNLHCWYTEGLDAGSYAYVQDWILNLSPTEGWHDLEVCTDVYNVVSESSESDNCWSRDFYWGTTPGDPDLQATDVNWSPSSPDSSDPIDLIGTVTNIGTEDSGTFENRLYLQGILQCSWTVTNLAAGQTSVHNCSVGTLSAGDYIVSLQVDANNSVAESNETNNNLNDIMTVGGEPDIDVSPTSLEYTCLEQASTSHQTGAYCAEGSLSKEVLTLKNPAAVYCAQLGYKHEIVTSAKGAQRGICRLPEGSTCGEWDFLSGTCGPQYSLCAREGLETLTLTDGRNPFSAEYAVCTDSEGNIIGSVTDMMDLAGLSGGSVVQRSLAESFSSYEPSTASTSSTFQAPAAFDWRNYDGGDWTTPVRDQGICGSCWAFSAVGISESAFNIASDNYNLDLDLSEEYLVTDCALDEGSCAGGSKDLALDYIQTNGVPDEACLTYLDGVPTGCTYTLLGACDAGLCTYSTGDECSDFRCTDRCADWADRLHMIDGNTYIGYYATPAAIQAALVAHGPVAVSMNMGGTFDANDVYRCTDNSSTNHAVIIVGYDNTAGTWIVRNSWGDDWGPDGDGYFQVAYDNCAIQKYPYYATASADSSGLTITNRGSAELVVESVSKVNSSCWLLLSPQQSLPVTLAPGQSTVIDVSYDCACVGEGTFYETIRINSTDPDEDPFNVSVTLHKVAPDLVVSQPQPSVSPPFQVSQSVDWSVTTTNQGGGNAAITTVGYYLGNSCSDLNNLVNSDTVDALLPGQSETDSDTYAFVASDAGTLKYMLAYADYLNEEPGESNESNNTSCYGPFEVRQCYSLSTGVNPAGSGSVSANPPPNCGSLYLAGTQVSLTATPVSGYNFSYWSGDATGSTNPTTVTMDRNKSVTANFAQCYSLSTSVNPTGSGSVSASPPPNCGSLYLPGTQVSLTATPVSGYSFSNWSGDASGDTNPTTVTMDRNKSVTANFSTEADGDVSCDGQTNSVDGLFILQREVGLRPNDSYTCPAPADGLYLPACDVSQDGLCNSVDALFILQCEVGIPNLLCPPSATAAEPGEPRGQDRESPSDAVLKVGSGDLVRGSDITVPLIATLDGTGLGAATIEVQYDPTVVEAIACAADPNNVFDMALCNVDTQSGRIQLTAVSTIAPGGELVLADITLQAVDDGKHRSPLTLLVSTFADGSGTPLDVALRHGRIKILTKGVPTTGIRNPVPVTSPVLAFLGDERLWTGLRSTKGSTMTFGLN